MAFEETLQDGILFLKIQGDLIGENSGPELMEKANDRILEGVVLCAIDICEVRYINSSGLGVFITLLTKFRNEGGEVVLINPSDQVKQTLLITKLTSIFTIVGDKPEAITALQAAKA